MTSNDVPEKYGVEGSAFARGLFLAGCRTTQEVCNATFALQPPFQQMPQHQGLVGLTKWLLEKDLYRRPRSAQAVNDSWVREGDNSSAYLEQSPLRSSHRMATTGITIDNYSPQL